VAIDAQGLSKSAIAAWLSGARRRIGFDGRWGRELSRWLNTERVPITAVHVVDRNLQLLEPLDIRQPTARFGMPEAPEERAAAERILTQLSVGLAPAIINVGAGWPSKLWPTERFAAVARHLQSRWALPTLLVYGSAGERDMAEQMARLSGDAARLAPSTTLTELRGLARSARLFIGCDTGPLHLAASVGTPCVGLFGPWPAREHGPYGADHIALQAVAMTGTRQRRHASPELMKKITVEQACEACDTVLQRLERGVA
jgi:ADP-heptose:LPS heptosyltransferase